MNVMGKPGSLLDSAHDCLKNKYNFVITSAASKIDFLKFYNNISIHFNLMNLLVAQSDRSQFLQLDKI